MAIDLVAQEKGNNNDTYSTGSMDTTGASLLVVTFADVFADGSPPTITDTYSNTWVEARRSSPFGQASSIFYAWNPTVGVGHSVTITGTDQYGSGQFSAFSGVDTTADPLDQSNENLAFSSATVQPGSVTPTSDGQLVIAHAEWDNATGMSTVDSGFTSPSYGDVGQGAVYLGSGMAYLIQTTAAAVNPTFTRTSGTSHQYATIATFKAGAELPPGGSVGGSISWVGSVTGSAPSEGIGSVSGSVAWVGSVMGNMPIEPGVWYQIAPVNGLDPDDPTPGANFGYQAVAVASNGTVFAHLDYTGLYRSIDNGVSWTKFNADAELDIGSAWILRVDPFDDDVMWATAGYGGGGPLKSTDGGANWTKMTVGSPTAADDVYCIALDPYLADHVLVTWHSDWSGQASSGVSESFNGGTSWANINAPTDDWNTGHAVFFLNDSDSWLVGTQDDGYWRTTNGGTSWAQVLSEVMTHGANDCLTKVGSDYFLAAEHHIHHSDDDCATWTDITGSLSTGVYYSAVATDGVNLYTAASFPVTPDYAVAAGPVYTRLVSGGSWSAMTGSPDVTFEGNSNGPRMVAYDGEYVYTANYMAGVWRLAVPEAISEGLVDGSISWVGSVIGQALHAGSVDGNVSWVGSISGVSIHEGSVDGAISWIGVVVGGNLGFVLGAVGWTGTVSGARSSQGTISGAVDWDGTVEGSTPTVGINEGVVDGAISWDGAVSGSRIAKGDVSGSISWTGVVVGGNLGVVIGAIGWTGTVSGARNPQGSVDGAVDWDGTVEGSAPTVGVNDGSVNGAISWVGSVDGARSSIGAVSGAVGWSGVVVGGNLGVVIGAVMWVGSVQGVSPSIDGNEGSVNGAISWVGSVIGSTQRSGAIGGAISWVGIVTALYTIDPAIFLLSPHAKGYKPRIVSGYKSGIPKGRG